MLSEQQARASEMHRKPGPGLLEAACNRCLCRELQ